MGVSLATFKMYNCIIILEKNWASFGLVFEGDLGGNFYFDLATLVVSLVAPLPGHKLKAFYKSVMRR